MYTTEENVNHTAKISSSWQPCSRNSTLFSSERGRNCTENISADKTTGGKPDKKKFSRENGSLRLIILISGRGSNMAALINACEAGNCPAEVIAVFSDSKDAAGLSFAQDRGIRVQAVDRTHYKDKKSFESAFLTYLKQFEFDCLCLAGFMRVLSPDFLDCLADKTVINIHPSLLPAYKGLHVHERVLEAGEAYSGCTVHHVLPEVDSGDIIVQKKVAVLPNDTPETLAARILEKEHEAYPEAIRLLAARKMRF